MLRMSARSVKRLTFAPHRVDRAALAPRAIIRVNVMLPSEDSVELFRTRHALDVVFVAALDGRPAVTAGSFQSLKHTGLCKALVGDPEAVARLSQSLEGQILPQVWTQGGDVAYATTAGTYLVVLFETSTGDAATSYKRSRELDQRVRAELVPFA